MNTPAIEQYRQREEQYALEAAAMKKRMDRISNLRLVVFLIALVAPIILVNTGQPIVGGIIMLFGIICFVILLLKHSRVILRHERASLLTEINREGRDRCLDDWGRRKRDGARFVNHEHPYSSDLDIFGRRSLYQWINSTRTVAGSEALAAALSGPREFDEILLRQESIRELAPEIDWRQRIEAAAATVSGKDWRDLISWGETQTTPWFISIKGNLLRLLPVVVWTGGVAGFIMGLGFAPLVLLIALQAVLASTFARSLGTYARNLEPHRNDLQAACGILAEIEAKPFTSGLNRELQAPLQIGPDDSASGRVGRLDAIAGALEVRHNPILHFIFNNFLLWDLQWCIRAEHWRQANGGRVRTWLHSISEMEALASLSIIPFENPEWPFPVLESGKPFEAGQLAHPLVPAASRVANDFSIPSEGMVSVITGSNMSGKSTFLRTVGINLVLAYAGAPVCARSFAAAIMPIHTSMRVMDDLASGVSSFYAELLRMRRIVEASKEQRILYLIDEIFRGTNSRDRVAGASEVLRNLSATSSVGLVSTHDLELSKLADEAPASFVPYHFSEQYRDDQIEFDYTLQPGPSRSTNARFLMKMLGISP